MSIPIPRRFLLPSDRPHAPVCFFRVPMLKNYPDLVLALTFQEIAAGES